MSKKYDLVIAHRVYPGISKTPFIKNVSKYELLSFNLKSLKNSFGLLKVKIFFILDNCPKKFEDLINKIFCDYDCELIVYNSPQGGVKTFFKQIEILSEQNESNIIYFSEDDYLYKKNSLEQAIEIFLKKKDVIDFMTRYEAPDYNIRQFHNYKKEKIFVNDFKLINVSCTTFTFLTTKDVLIETKHIFKSYKFGNYDSSIFISLTKLRILPLQNLKSLFFERDIVRYIKAYLFGGLQIIFGKKFNLYSFSPSLATHMEESGVGKNVNWMEIINEN